MAVIDRVLRFVRNNSKPFGGVLIIATGDPHQLSPMEGRPFWISSMLFTCFTTLRLEHYVRAAADPELQQLTTILRNVACTDGDVEIFAEIIQRRVLQRRGGCVSSWQLVPEHYLKVVGTREGCRTILREYLRIKQNDGTRTFTYVCTDHVQTNRTTKLAGAQISTFLSNHVQELVHLVLFVGAVVRLTFNNNSPRPHLPRFSQGQLAIVEALPDPAAPDGRLHLRLVPLHERVFDVQAVPRDWPHVILTRRKTPALRYRTNTLAWRLQFPVAYYICLTVHRAIGQTCPLIATQISNHQRQFRLWTKEQLLVILSRPRTLDGVLIVTHDHADFIAALTSLLVQKTH